MRDVPTLSIADCASGITALYDVVDAAETAERDAVKRRKEAERQTTALVDYLAVVVPETTIDAYLIAALLDTEIKSDVQRDDKQLARVGGIIRNLHAGLRRIVEADPSTNDYRLPPWLKSPTPRPFGGDDDEAPPA